jgi:hypothetical protein
MSTHYFNRSDAQQLVDMLNPSIDGTGPVAALRNRMFFRAVTTSAITARVGDTLGSGTARIEPDLPSGQPLEVTIASTLTTQLPAGVKIVIQREQVTNQWLIRQCGTSAPGCASSITGIPKPAWPPALSGATPLGTDWYGDTCCWRAEFEMTNTDWQFENYETGNLTFVRGFTLDMYQARNARTNYWTERFDGSPNIDEMKCIAQVLKIGQRDLESRYERTERLVIGRRFTTGLSSPAILTFHRLDLPGYSRNVYSLSVEVEAFATLQVADETRVTKDDFWQSPSACYGLKSSYESPDSTYFQPRLFSENPYPVANPTPAGTFKRRVCFIRTFDTEDPPPLELSFSYASTVAALEEEDGILMDWIAASSNRCVCTELTPLEVPAATSSYIPAFLATNHQLITTPNSYSLVADTGSFDGLLRVITYQSPDCRTSGFPAPLSIDFYPMTGCGVHPTSSVHMTANGSPMSIWINHTPGNVLDLLEFGFPSPIGRPNLIPFSNARLESCPEFVYFVTCDGNTIPHGGTHIPPENNLASVRDGYFSKTGSVTNVAWRWTPTFNVTL